MNKTAHKKTSAPAGFKGWKYLLFMLVFFLYGNTLKFDFVLDDDLFVRNHPMVQQGVSAIPSAFTQGSMPHFKGSNFQIYRPAVVSFFTLEHAAFGNKPGGYHFMNILLYALVCMACFDLLRKLFPKFHPFYALLGAGVYLLHPVHTEVVANIKSQDELLAALGCFLSLRYALTFIDAPEQKRWLVYSILSYLLALFSKESAVAFLAIIPLTVFLTRSKAVLESIRFTLPFLGAALFFVGVRYLALRGVEQAIETTVIENVLYGAESLPVLFATKAVILFYFWKLLIWPDPLSWDYSYNQIPLSDWSEVLPWISVVLYLAALFVAFRYRTRYPSISWGLLFFLILIVPTSNILFLNGTTFAERFLFLPSFGAAVALVSLVSILTKQGSEFRPAINEKPVLLVLLICGMSLFATFTRSKEWKDNFALFESGVKNAPNSSRVQMGYATELMNKAEKTMVMQERTALIRKSQEGFQRALEIWPGNAVAAYKLGLISNITGDTSTAVSFYKQSLASRPDYVFSLVNLGSIYAARQQYDSALIHLSKAFAVDSLNEMVITNLTVVQFNKGAAEEVVRMGDFAARNGKSLSKVEELARVAKSRLDR